MAKYNWTNDTLKERFTECVMLWNKETNPKLKELYFNTALNIKSYLETNIPDQYSLLELYNFEKETLNNCEFLWPLYQEFAQVNHNGIKVPELKKSSLNPKDILELTHDFYKSLNPFLFENFMQNFYHRNDHIRFTPRYDTAPCDGINISIPHRKEAFIEIMCYYTLEDVITTIHEYGHLTSYTINPFNKSNPNFYYTEVITTFFELIGADYLGKIFGQDNATILKGMTYNTTSDLANITNRKIDLIIGEDLLPNGYTKNKDLKKIAKELLGLDSLTTENLFKNYNLEIDDYVIGYIIALELYYIYLEDKDRALHILKRMLLYNAKSRLDYYNNLIRLGIIPNLHLEEFRETLQDEMALLTRKK